MAILLIGYAVMALGFAVVAGLDTSPDRDDVTLAIWKLLFAALWPLALSMAIANSLANRDNDRRPEGRDTK